MKIITKKYLLTAVFPLKETIKQGKLRLQFWVSNTLLMHGQCDDKDVWARNDQGRNNPESFPKQLNVVQEKKYSVARKKAVNKMYYFLYK